MKYMRHRRVAITDCFKLEVFYIYIIRGSFLNQVLVYVSNI